MPSVREHGGHVVAAKGPTGTPFDYLLPRLKDRPGSHLPGAPKKVVDDLNALGARSCWRGHRRLHRTDPQPAAQANDRNPNASAQGPVRSITQGEPRCSI